MTKYQVKRVPHAGRAGGRAQALAAAMAPFDINLSGEWNPRGEWDWWRIHAGDRRFAVRPEHGGDPHLIF